MPFNRTNVDWNDDTKIARPPLYLLGRAFDGVSLLMQNPAAAADFYKLRNVRKGLSPRVELDHGLTGLLSFCLAKYQIGRGQVWSNALGRPYRRAEIAAACGMSEDRVTHGFRVLRTLGYMGSHQSRDPRSGDAKITTRWFTDKFWVALGCVGKGFMGLLAEYRRVTGQRTNPKPPKGVNRSLVARVADAAKASMRRADEAIDRLYAKSSPQERGWPAVPLPDTP